MSDATANRPPAATHSLYERTDNVKRRRQRGAIVKYLGIAAISIVLFFLATLLWSIFSRGIPAFFQYETELELYYDPEIVDPSGNRDPDEIGSVSLIPNYDRLFAQSLTRDLEAAGVDLDGGRLAKLA